MSIIFASKREEELVAKLERQHIGLFTTLAFAGVGFKSEFVKEEDCWYSVEKKCYVRRADAKLMKFQGSYCDGITSYVQDKDDRIVYGRTQHLYAVCTGADAPTALICWDKRDTSKTVADIFARPGVRNPGEVSMLVMVEERLLRAKEHVAAFHAAHEFAAGACPPPVFKTEIVCTIYLPSKAGFGKLLEKAAKLPDRPKSTGIRKYVAENTKFVAHPREQQQEDKYISKLKRQYPCIQKVLDQLDASCHDAAGPETRTILNFQVRRADSDLMLYRGTRGDGLLEYSFWSSEYPQQEAGRREFLYAFDQQDRLMKLMTWHGRGAERTVKAIFDTSTISCDKSQVKCLIFAQEWSWRNERHVNAYRKVIGYSNNKTLFPPTVLNRVIEVTIYLPPRQGFDKLLSECDLSTNVTLTKNALLKGFWDPEFRSAGDKVQELAELFEQRVFFTGLQKAINDCRKSGMSGVFCKDIQVLSFCTAGRALVSLRRGGDELTVIGPDEPGTECGMGWQSICATLPAATALVNDVIAAWETSSLPVEERMIADEEVGIIC